MSWKNLLIIAIAAVCVLEGFLLLEKRQFSRSDLNYATEYQQNNKIFALLIPKSLNFAGEEVPLNTYYVREGLDRELSLNAYWQSNTLILLKKANRFFPVIEPILKKNKIPDDFKYLALIESGLTNVVSPSGASGFWQFIPETAKRYGLEVGEEVDERYHVEKSTEAACKLLMHSYGMFSDWTLCAAAYNTGEQRIQKEIERQKVNSYYDLYLNTETSRYIYRILALKLLYEHPTEFGYYIRNKDLYPPIPTHTVTLDSTVDNLVTLALKLNINYRVLKDFNPWLRKDKLTVKPGKKYLLAIPDKGYQNYESLFKSNDEAERIFHDTLTAGKLFK